MRTPARVDMRHFLTGCLTCLAVAGCTGVGANPPIWTGSGSGSGPNGIGGPSGGPPGTGSGGATSRGLADIGFVTAARLNQTQYNNTVHDLLGTSLTPANAFPPDETSLGFNTISSVLRLQPEHIEQYVSAAQAMMTEFFARPATDPMRMRYITCDYMTGGPSCTQQILSNFASKAWRRPVVTSELAPLLALAAAQATPQAGLQVALEAALVSTKFVYRLEFDSNPNNTTAHRLTAYELANRLSYLLWSTMPDDELFASAASGALLTDNGLQAQVTRMLGVTPKAQSLVSSFGAQWLGVSGLGTITPDPMLFPKFNDAIRQAMVAETTSFLWDFVSNALPIPQLLTASFTYVNQPLAAHYGLPAVQGQPMQRVSTAGTNRAGLLTQGTFLAGFSNATRTSPVKRGLYVLSRLLCSSPPAPPPNVNQNLDQVAGAQNLSVRQQLLAHEQLGPSCAACHKVMDPIGLGMENFDAVGQYRTSDSFGPIDATGTIPNPTGTGTLTFKGEPQLAAILANDPRLLPCAVQQLVTFGLGRSFGPPGDQVALDRLVASTASGGQSFVSAFRALTMDDVFRSRRAAAQSEVMP